MSKPESPGSAPDDGVSPPAPTPNSYWLPGGRVLAGEYPGALNDDDARAKLGALLDAGITTFVDLTALHDRMTPYEHVLAEEAVRRSVQASHLSIAIPDMGVATPAVMNRVLDVIDEHLAAGRLVYVHCWGGVGRTGTVVGCHLVRSGATGAGALAQVRALFASMTEEKVRAHQGRSPQTPEQCEMVRGWQGHDRGSRGGHS